MLLHMESSDRSSMTVPLLMSSPAVVVNKPMRSTQEMYRTVLRLKEKRNEERERSRKLRTRLHAAQREAVRRERSIRELNRLRQSKYPISELALHGIEEDANTHLAMFRRKCAELEEEIMTVDDEIADIKRTERFTHLVELQAELTVWLRECERLRKDHAHVQEVPSIRQRSYELNECMTNTFMPTLHELEACSDLPDSARVAELAEEAQEGLDAAIKRRAEVQRSIKTASAELSHRRGCKVTLEELWSRSTALEPKTVAMNRTTRRLLKENGDFAVSGEYYDMVITDEVLDGDFVTIRQRLVDRAEQDEQWCGLLRLLGGLPAQHGGVIDSENLVGAVAIEALPTTPLDTIHTSVRLTDLLFRIDLAGIGEAPVEPCWREPRVRWRARGMEKKTVRQAMLTARSSQELLEAIGESKVVAFWENAGVGATIRALDLSSTAWHQLGKRRILRLMEEVRGMTKQQWQAELPCELDVVTYEQFVACNLLSGEELEDLFVLLLAVSSPTDRKSVDVNFLYDLPVEAFVAALKREEPSGSCAEDGSASSRLTVTSQKTLPTCGVVEGDGGMDLADLFSVDRSNLGREAGEEVSQDPLDSADLGELRSRDGGGDSTT